MALDQGVLDAVTNSNFKILAEQVSTNTAAHQNRLNILAEKALAKSLESMDTMQVGEGLGISAAQRGDLAKQLADLTSVVASMQANAKQVQTIPPQTGGTS